MLCIKSGDLERSLRIFEKMGIAKLTRAEDGKYVEMFTVEKDDIKNLIYEVIWENKKECFRIYRALIEIDPAGFIATKN